MTEAVAKIRALANAAQRGADFGLGELLREQCITAIGPSQVTSNLWSFAAQVGCPNWLVGMVVADHLQYHYEVSQRVAVASAPALFTVRLMRFLPWLSLLGAQLLGLQPLQFLVGGVAGWFTLAAAVGLGWLAHKWQQRISERARVVAPDPGLWLALMAAALGQGASVDGVMQALNQYAFAGAGLVQEWRRVSAEVFEILQNEGDLAKRLESRAEGLRQDAATAKAQELETLNQQFLLPIGVFVIPQFLLILVVPTVFAALTKT